MTKKRPSLGNVLQGRGEPEVEISQGSHLAPEAGSRRERSPIAQRGKRANAEYAQLSVPIPRELRARFKAKVALEETSISDTVEDLIRQYLDGV